MTPTSAAMPAEGASTAGFALVEMLVAMLLLSLAGLALTHFQTFQLRGSHSARSIAAARIIADNRAVDLAVAPVAPAALEGDSKLWGTSVHWSARGVAAAGLPPGFVRIDIAASLGGDGTVIARRTLLRPRQLPVEDGQ